MFAGAKVYYIEFQSTTKVHLKFDKIYIYAILMML